MGPTAGLDGCGKSRPPPAGIRSPDRPARSESLYRLSSPGKFYIWYERKSNDNLANGEEGGIETLLFVAHVGIVEK